MMPVAPSAGRHPNDPHSTASSRICTPNRHQPQRVDPDHQIELPGHRLERSSLLQRRTLVIIVSPFRHSGDPPKALTVARMKYAMASPGTPPFGGDHDRDVRQQDPHQVKREGRVETVDGELPCFDAVIRDVSPVVEERSRLL